MSKGSILDQSLLSETQCEEVDEEALEREKYLKKEVSIDGSFWL
jgi:hypothetical protein